MELIICCLILCKKGGAKKDIFGSLLTQRSKHDTTTSLRNGGRDMGLAQASKFRSGHSSSGVVPVSQTVHVRENDSGSGSDMDISPDSDDEVYRRKYSVKSPRQDHKIGNDAATKPGHKQGSGSAMEQVVGQSSAFSATTYVPKATGSIPSTAPGKGCTGYKVSDVSNRLGACDNCFFSLILLQELLEFCY